MLYCTVLVRERQVHSQSLAPGAEWPPGPAPPRVLPRACAPPARRPPQTRARCLLHWQSGSLAASWLAAANYVLI